MSRQPDGWPFIYLKVGPVGPGFDTFLTGLGFKGVITNATIWFFTASGLQFATLSLDGVPFLSSDVAGLPSGTAFTYPVSDLMLPVGSEQVIRADLNGSGGDLFAVWVTGYTWGDQLPVGS